MASDLGDMRTQVLANARLLLRLPNSSASTSSLTTLTNPPNNNQHDNIDIGIYGETGDYTAVVMLGIIPAIRGAEAATHMGAIAKLLNATAELLKLYIPKIGAHQRNIHGGGVFDANLIPDELK